jgi:hypothetical protein
MKLIFFVLGTLFFVSCKGESVVKAWCSDAPATGETAQMNPNWHEHIEPLVRDKCLGCHTPGGLAPLDLSQLTVFKAAKASIKDAVVSRRMPPFMAAPCCVEYSVDRSLTQNEIELVTQFVDNGMREGDPAKAPPKMPTKPPLSRIDVTVKMPANYVPKPPEPDSTDDNRCFALDWPRTETAFITGLSPRPGNRKIVHHLIVAALNGATATEAKNLDAADPLPGFDCNGGLGRFQGVPIGGSLIGGDLPRGLGTEVAGGSIILLNVHYSTAGTAGAESDLTEIDFKVEPKAQKASGIVIANPA